MKTYKLNNVEISEKDLKQLIQDNPELLKKSNSVPFKKGDDYYFINAYGEIQNNNYWCDDEIDNYLLDIGNAFKTREEAEKKIKQMQAFARVNRYIRENDLRLTDVDCSNDEQKRWSIYYNIYLKKIEAGDWCFSDYKMLIGDLKSEEAGEQVIGNCIDDLKIIFDVNNICIN